MSVTTKRYIVSSLVTFFSAFIVVVLADIDGITIQAIKDGALVGLGFSALRAGVKALLEFFIISTK